MQSYEEINKKKSSTSVIVMKYWERARGLATTGQRLGACGQRQAASGSRLAAHGILLADSELCALLQLCTVCQFLFCIHVSFLS